MHPKVTLPLRIWSTLRCVEKSCYIPQMIPYGLCLPLILLEARVKISIEMPTSLTGICLYS